MSSIAWHPHMPQMQHAVMLPLLHPMQLEWGLLLTQDETGLCAASQLPVDCTVVKEVLQLRKKGVQRRDTHTTY